MENGALWVNPLGAFSTPCRPALSFHTSAVHGAGHRQVPTTTPASDV